MVNAIYKQEQEEVVLTLGAIESETLTGWLAWFLDEGENELYPDAIEILSNILTAIDEAGE